MFNDSSITILTYPEVEFFKNKPLSNPKLFVYERNIGKKELFDNLFHSIIWISYRRGFRPLYTSPYRNSVKTQSTAAVFHQKSFTSDCGWGCMIRCCQMLLANTLQKLSDEKFLQLSINTIIRKFMDLEEQPFSIQSIVSKGKQLMDKQPGDWYGVNSVTQVIQSIVAEQQESGYDECFNKFEFYAAQEGCVFMQEIQKRVRKGYERINQYASDNNDPLNMSFELIQQMEFDQFQCKSVQLLPSSSPLKPSSILSPKDEDYISFNIS